MSEQKKPWEQNWNQPTANNSDSTNKKPWEQNWSEEKTDRPKDKGFLGQAKDLGVSLIPKGLAGVAELGVGLSDIMSDGATGKILQDKGIYNAKAIREELNTWHTDQYKSQQQEFADAGKDGNWVDKVVDKTKVALTNPSLIANTVVESLPSMIVGGLLGRATGIANPVLAGAVGEGAVMAGSQAEQIRQETVDGRLTADQSLASVGTGALGGLFGFAGGRLAQKMGLADVDTAMQTGRLTTQQVGEEIAKTPMSAIPTAMIKGAFSEGFLEELPQSVSEQIIQNLALQKDWHDGIEDAAVMGTLAGMAMGGAVSGAGKTGDWWNDKKIENQHIEQQKLQDILADQNVQSGVEQQRVWGKEDQQAAQRTWEENNKRAQAAQNDAWVREDIHNQSRYLEQPVEQMGNLGNRIGYHPDDVDLSYRLAASNDAIQVSPNGDALTPEQLREIQQEKNDRRLRGENWVDITPIPKKFEQLGINPDDGPMSAAAALAVDSGASPTAQLGYTPEQQPQEQSNTPISDVVPNDYRQLLGNHNEGQSFNTNFEDAAIQQGNAQSDNAGESISQQYDINTADEMAGEFEKNGTESAPQTKTTQPILGQDGKNKWFGSQEKAKAFLDKKNLGNDYQVAQDGKRFEIQPKSQVAQNQNDNLNNQNSILNTKNTISNTENNIDKIQKISALEQQLANEKSVIKKVRLRKQITELQNGLDQNQVSASLDEPRKATAENLSGEFKRMEQATARVNAVRQRMREANPEIFTAENDRVRETHGLTNARVTMMADEIETSGSYELSDREYEKIYNNPNFKIDYNPKTYTGTVTAIKDPHTGEWVGNNAKSEVDNAAHAAATSVQNDLPAPTQAQIEAGNYKKGHVKVQGLDISIENPRGSNRSGKDADGKEWSHTMSDHYGYINRTKGADQEQIDTYIGKNPDSDSVFVIDQIHQSTGKFDEHKVMIGYDSEQEAISAYQSNFDKGWKVGPVTQMSKDQFKDWLKNSDTSKPVAESGQKTEPQHPVNKWQEEMNKALAKADPENPLFRKLQVVAKNGTKSENDRAVFLKQAREIEKQAEAKKINTYGWDRLHLAENLTIDEIEELTKQVKEEHALERDENGAYIENGKQSLNIYDKKGMKKLDALSWAMYYKTKKKDDQPKENKSQGEPLYSRQSGSRKTGITVDQVRDVLIKRFGKETIDELERQGKLEIIQDYSVEGVEGFYQNGKAVLVASNLTAESTVPTFLHELGGHAGFQNMMSQKQYNELMNQFNKLVDQGNPVAMAAKILAEREQGSERQQLEYLPYLLTLSSTMQQRNVIQRNALQKLINNIISYVKAWAFDRFGVNLNLNPDDILALSERMIQQSSVIAHAQSKEQQNPSSVFSEKAKSVFTNAFTVSKDEQQRIAKDIDRLIESLQSYPQPVQMKMPPVLLALTGIREELNIQDLPLELDRFTLRKMTGRVDGKKDVSHQLTLDQIKKLPNELANPLAILQSDDGRNLTIVTSMQDPAGNPVISAIHLNKQKGKYVINELATTFGRERFMTWLEKRKDKVIYSNAEKSKGSKYPTLPHFLGKLETTHVGVVGTRTSNQSVLSPDDVVNFFKQNEQPLFSRSSNYDDITNRIANGFKSLPKIGDLINDKGVDWLKFGLRFLSRRHLTEVYGKLLPPLKKYNELAAQMDADKNDIAAEADNIAREWSKLNKKIKPNDPKTEEEALAELMHDATLAQIDPAKPYQSGDDQVKYQQLHKAYNALSPEAQTMYKKARDAYSGHYEKVREAIRERILRSALSSQKKVDLLKKIEGSFGQIKGVYFPLARFGKYIVVMRNQNGQAEVISRAETKSAAESMRSELMKKYPQYKADDVKKDAEFSVGRDSVGRGFMSDLFDEVGNLGLDKKAQADFEDTLSQLYLSSMPDLSWAKHGMHRKGTAGFSQDARRAFAQHMFSGANYLGKLRYGDQLAQQLDEMKKYSEDQFEKGVGYDQNSASDVIDEMEKRHENLMNPQGSPVSSFLTSVGFMYYMGLSPAAAMVNLSQTALIAYPIMGAKWGFDNAGKELLKASREFGVGLKDGYENPDFSSVTNAIKTIGNVYNPNIINRLKGDELKAYEEAVKRGVIDITQAHDLAGIAQGEDSKVMWHLRPAMRLASGMFHHAERFNREVTFIAAYRLARQHINANGSETTHTEAFEQAMDIVYKGHFDYSTGNRARFLQGSAAKVLFLFKQYAQNMIYTLVRNAHQSIYALDPNEQKEARRALAGILGMHALAAGAIGLPITGMLFTASILIAKKSKLGSAAFFAAWAAAFFGAGDGDEEDPYELENVIRNWLADIHPMFADLVFGGVPRAFSPVDLSGRVGLNNLVIPDVQEGLEGADWAKAMQSAMLGPVVGISTSAVQGLQQIREGDYGRGIETMLPVVLKNAMKSIRFANEGVLTKNKDIIQEDVSGIGIFSQAIGFSPASVRTSYEGRSAIFQYKAKLSNYRSELMHKWVVARRNDDSDGMDEAWAEILEFNNNVAEKNPKMRISRINLMQSYKATERKAKETGDGGVYLTKRQKGAEEQGGFAFDR